MFKVIRILVLTGLCLTCGENSFSQNKNSETPSKDVNKKVFKISIVPSTFRSTGKPLIDNVRDFYVILTNISGSDISVWEWGANDKYSYRNLSFVVEHDDKQYTITREPVVFGRGSSPRIVQKNCHAVFKINLESEWRGLPKGFFDPNKRVKIKAVFKIEETDWAKKAGVWNGKIESGFQEVIFGR